MEPRPFRRGDAQQEPFPEEGKAASMEPRPFRRGDVTVEQQLATRIRLLQWSHALSGVETRV